MLLAYKIGCRSRSDAGRTLTSSLFSGDRPCPPLLMGQTEENYKPHLFVHKIKEIYQLNLEIYLGGGRGELVVRGSIFILGHECSHPA